MYSHDEMVYALESIIYNNFSIHMNDIPNKHQLINTCQQPMLNYMDNRGSFIFNYILLDSISLFILNLHYPNISTSNQKRMKFSHKLHLYKIYLNKIKYTFQLWVINDFNDILNSDIIGYIKQLI
jgi:hypothetical protein